MMRLGQKHHHCLIYKYDQDVCCLGAGTVFIIYPTGVAIIELQYVSMVVVSIPAKLS